MGGLLASLTADTRARPSASLRIRRGSFGATIESVVWRWVSQWGRFLRQLVHVFAKEVLFVAI